MKWIVGTDVDSIFTIPRRIHSRKRDNLKQQHMKQQKTVMYDIMKVAKPKSNESQNDQIVHRSDYAYNQHKIPRVKNLMILIPSEDVE